MEVLNIPIIDVLKKFEIEAVYDKNIKCPLHTDTTPSFRIYRSNTFTCFSGCGSGNNITFVSKLLDISKQEAAEKLRSLFSDDTCITNTINTSKEPKESREQQAQQELTHVLPEWYSDNELDYLKFHKLPIINSRSIENIYVSHKYKYNLWSLYKNPSKKIIDNYNLGVGYINGYDYIYNNLRLIVPLYNKGYPYPVGYAGRSLRNSKLKWITLEKSERCQQFSNISETSDIVIVENYIDSFLLEEKFNISTVALGGILNYKSYDFIKNISRYNKIFILLDNSDIGNNIELFNINQLNNKKLKCHSLIIRDRLIETGFNPNKIQIVDYPISDTSLDPYWFIENNIKPF